MYVSVHPAARVSTKKGLAVLSDFPWRVKDDEAKRVQWLQLIPLVEEKQGGLEVWGTTGTARNDSFLDWIEEEWANPGGEFHTPLRECLVRRFA